MTEAHRDDLIVELSLYSPSQVRKIVAEYQQHPTPDNCNYPFYEFLREKLEIDGYWKIVGLACIYQHKTMSLWRTGKNVLYVKNQR